LCPSFIEDLPTKVVGLHVADSHTGNHQKDDLTPLEIIRRPVFSRSMKVTMLVIIWSDGWRH
nr:hypothetical protein [Tanacetum cinerariifolium]